MLEKFLKQTKFSSQEDFIKNFCINVPENFNFGYDVVDEWARIAPEKKALCWTMNKTTISISRLPTSNERAIRPPLFSSHWE